MAGELQPLMDSQPGGGAGGLASLLSTAIRKFALGDDNMVPARVTKFDRKKNIVNVQPLIMWIGIDDKNYSRKEIKGINCLSLGGGGFHISFPIKVGDLGWIVAADRDIELFKQSLAESPPNSYRYHSFADALFVPDVFRKYTINSEDESALVIQSTDSQTRISVYADKIKITAPSKVTVDTPLTEFTGDVKIDKNLRVEQDSSLIGNATVTGQATANGGFTASNAAPCTLPPNTTIAGKQVNGHTHPDPQGGNTGPF